MSGQGISAMLRPHGRLCVVIGAGSVGLRRARSLLAAGATVRLVDPRAEAIEGVESLLRAYQPEDLAGAWLVCACTDSSPTNEAVAQDARRAGCGLVYRADDPNHSDVTFQSMRREGPLVFSASSEGNCPALSRRLVEQLALPDRIGQFAELLGQLRRKVFDATGDATERRRILAALSSPAVYEMFTSRGAQAVTAEADRLLQAPPVAESETD